MSDALYALEHWFGRFSLNAWREGMIEPGEKEKAKNALAIEDGIRALESEKAALVKLAQANKEEWGKEYSRAEALEARAEQAEAEQSPEPSHHATVARQFHRISVLEADLAAAVELLHARYTADFDPWTPENHAVWIARVKDLLKRAAGP